eukprot:m.211055 g.211055  ORF g.211055 m.211055 type:complete len:948 (+) comp10745_c0_seq3:1995-4838(+)
MAQPPKRYRSESATDDQGWSISRQMIEINERLCSEIERLQQRCAELEKVLASVEQPQSHETYMTQLLHARFIFSQWVQERYHNDLAPVYDYDVLLKALENLETLKQPSFRPYFDHCHQMVETGHDGRISHAHVKKSIVALMYTQIHQLPGRQPFAEDGSAYFRGLGLSLEGAQTLYHMGLSLSKSTCASHEKELTTDVFHLDLAEWIRRASERPNVQFTIVFDGFYSLRYANRPGSGPSAQPLSGTTVILVAHEVPSPLPNAAAIPERHSKPTLAEIAANAQRRCFGTFWAGESSFSLEDDKVLSSERLWARLKKIDKVRWNQLHESFCIRENTFLVDYFPQWRTEKSEDVAEMLAYLLEIPALKKLLETSPVLSPGDRWVFVPFMKLFYALQSWEVAVEQARRLPPPAHATRQAMAARGQQMVDHPNSGPIMRQPSLESLSTNQFFAKVPPTPGMYHFGLNAEVKAYSIMRHVVQQCYMAGYKRSTPPKVLTWFQLRTTLEAMFHCWRQQRDKYIDASFLRRNATNVPLLTFVFWAEHILPFALFFYHYLFRWILGRGDSVHFQEWIAFALWALFAKRNSRYYDRACVAVLQLFKEADEARLRNFEACPAMLCERAVEVVHSSFRRVFRSSDPPQVTQRKFRQLFHSFESRHRFSTWFQDEIRRPGEMSYGNTLHSTKWEFQQRVATKLKRILQGLTASSENPVIKLRAGKGNRAEQITLPSLKPFGEVHVRNLAVPRRDTASQARGSRSRGRSSGQGRGRGRARVPNAAVVTPNDSHVRPDSESESSDVPAASATPCQDAPFDPAFALSPGFRASLHSGKFVPAAGRVALEFSCDKCNGRLLKTSDDWHVSTRCYWHRYHSKCEPSAETCELCLDTAKREIDEELVRLPEYYSATRLAQDDALEDAVPPANVHDDQIPPCEGEEEGLVDFSVLHIEELADISQSE